VPVDLLHSEVATLEQGSRPRPVIQQPPDPGQADQPDADLDAAGPVHTGQERVLLPPGPQLGGHPLGAGLIPAGVPGRREHGQVMKPGDLPDLLDVAGVSLGAVVDPECVAVRG
jgi:hypothetical protein